MEASKLREMSLEDLNKELLSLRKEQFNLRMQRATGQLAQVHEFSRVRKNIARIKTVISEMGAKSSRK